MLAKNQKVLSEYVEERLSVGTLERWVQIKTKTKRTQRKKSLRRRSRLCDWKVIYISVHDIIAAEGQKSDLIIVFSKGVQDSNVRRDDGSSQTSRDEQGEDNGGARQHHRAGSQRSHDQGVPGGVGGQDDLVQT